MEFEVRVDRVAAGGDGLATAPDGRVVFVPASVPGDRLRVEVVQQKKQFFRVRVAEVIDPSPDRVVPPCPHVAAGCGGCDWQHAATPAQQAMRVDLVRDAVRRIAKLPDLDVAAGPDLPPVGYRTTLRAAVSGGGGGYRMRRSNDVITPDSCLVLHPRLEQMLTTFDFGRAEEVVLRIGERTGESLVHVVAGPSDLELPPGVVLSSADEPGFITEVVGGHTFRISGPSFFQCRPDGAEAMVALVADAISGVDGPLLDAYAGVGLFGALLGQERPLTTVESAPSSVADSRINLPDHAEIVQSEVERWRPAPMAAVVADPARSGLGVDGAAVLAGTGAEVIALISCDAASMARDVALLGTHGYRPDWARVLDLFGHTSHVEVVTRLVLA
jgi:23S rRNA (uracil1939-C5)-methyltransferase